MKKARVVLYLLLAAVLLFGVLNLGVGIGVYFFSGKIVGSFALVRTSVSNADAMIASANTSLSNLGSFLQNANSSIVEMDALLESNERGIGGIQGQFQNDSVYFANLSIAGYRLQPTQSLGDTFSALATETGNLLTSLTTLRDILNGYQGPIEATTQNLDGIRGSLAGLESGIQSANSEMDAVGSSLPLMLDIVVAYFLIEGLVFILAGAALYIFLSQTGAKRPARGEE
jgi:hypothetical protein